MDFNPWQVENIEVFNYYCCPECVYRAKEEFDFQVHAIQNHVQSRTLFNHEHQQPKYENPDEASVEVKVELVENDSMAIDEFDEKNENSDLVQNTPLLSKKIQNNTKKIECDECHKECKSHSALLSHKKIHRTWTCEKCNKTMLKSKFKKHMETVHEEKNIEIFQCKCQYETFTQQDLDTHLQSCTISNKVTCELCQKVLSQSQLTKHLKNAHCDKEQENSSDTTCEVCQKECKSHQALLQHKRIHWTWTCEICKNTMLKSRFKKHMETEHGEKDIEIFTCKCQFETFTENDLNNHMESCTTINKVTCEFCHKKLSKFQLTKHIKNVHGDLVEETVKLEDKINDENNEPTLTFDDTDSFKQEDDLIDQEYDYDSSKESEQKDEKPTKLDGQFKCDECDKVCRNHRSLLFHKRLHATLPCEICKELLIKSKFKKHMETVHGKTDIQTFICKCRYVTYAQYDLDTHMQSCTVFNKVRVACEKCDKKVLQRCLKGHMEYAHGDENDKSGVCHHCGEYFKLLQQHIMYKHETKKPWKCDQCDFTHALEHGLKQHKKHSHPEESKLHVCHVCGYKTPGFSNLKEHIEVKHENVKPFPCNVCDARFYRKTRLEQHVKVKHLGEEPYKCDECGKTFRTWHTMSRHVRLIHKGMKYSCHLCGKEYPDKRGVRRHVLKVHDAAKRRMVQFDRQLVSYFPEGK